MIGRLRPLFGADVQSRWHSSSQPFHPSCFEKTESPALHPNISSSCFFEKKQRDDFNSMTDFYELMQAQSVKQTTTDIDCSRPYFSDLIDKQFIDSRVVLLHYGWMSTFWHRRCIIPPFNRHRETLTTSRIFGDILSAAFFSLGKHGRPISRGGTSTERLV